MVGDRKGFSFVELMIVLAIISILAAVAAPAYYNYVLRSRQSRAFNELLTIQSEEERYFVEQGAYADKIGLLPEYAAVGTAPGAFYDSPNGYRYLITAAGTIRAVGDLNQDGNYCDGWDLTQGDLMDKPKPFNTGCDEGFSWSFFSNLF